MNNRLKELASLSSLEAAGKLIPLEEEMAQNRERLILLLDLGIIDQSEYERLVEKSMFVFIKRATDAVGIDICKSIYDYAVYERDGSLFLDDFEYLDIGRTIESVLLVCPKCHDTKTVSVPPQTIQTSVNPPYRTECSKCRIWWKTYRG